MSHNQAYKILIAGGGTGGHIFPAIAIANELKQMNQADILFVGARNRMEMKKVPEAGYAIKGLWISGFQRKKLLLNILLPVKIVVSLLQSFFILLSFKPDVVVGVGGYSSGPVIFAGAVLGIPSLIQEQNSYAGIANKILGKFVRKICVAYEGMERFFSKEKIIFTGNPVRKTVIEAVSKKEEGCQYFQLNTSKRTVLVIGGSLGAKTINESMSAHLNIFKEANLQFIWQTGTAYFEKAKQLVADIANIKVLDFIKEINLAYAAADIIVSRAGAISISELCIVGKPIILIPSPNVAEDHQTKNAMALVNKKAALIIKDSEAKDKLGKQVIALTGNPSLCKELSKNIMSMAKNNAAGDIAKTVLSLIKK